MSNWKEEALQGYRNEIFKQMYPYQYEILTDGIDVQTKSEELIVPANATVVQFPSFTGDILDFSNINTEFIVFISREGIAQKNIVKKLLEKAFEADIVYGDEDFINDWDESLKLDDGRECCLRTPWRKPDYSPDTLMSFPYIETYFAVRTDFAKTLELKSKDSKLSDEVRLYDFLLRAMEKTDRVLHVKEILFHRSLSDLLKGRDGLEHGLKDKSESYTAKRNVKRVKGKNSEVSDEDIFKALFDRYQKPGYELCIENTKNRLGFHILPHPEEDAPLLSVVIPSKDHPKQLIECIEKIKIAAGDIPFEVIVVDNGSSDENAMQVREYFHIHSDWKYYRNTFEFNYARMCNIGATLSQGSYLLFVNDDVVATDQEFVTKMLKYASLPHVGAVGCKLLYPEKDTIQHTGVTVINKGPSHKLQSLDDNKLYYYGRNKKVWDVLAVTGACLMVSKEKFGEVHGFNEQLKIGYNDVDLCVKLYESGYYNIVDNDCVLYHHESLSRGYDEDDISAMRLKGERSMFFEAHKWLLNTPDPFYHPMLDQDTIEYRAGLLPEYLLTDFRNESKEYKALPARASDKIEMAIERCYIERGISIDVEDAYVIEGWSFLKKVDNSLVSRYLVVCPVGEDGKAKKEHLEFMLSPKYRTDIGKVFPDAVNVDLAGFVCRIPVSLLKADSKYRLGICSRLMGGIGHYSLTLGDMYEPGRGIIKDK